MTTNSFTYSLKRFTQTGKSSPSTYDISSIIYKKSILTCTLGSLEHWTTFYSYPLVKLSYLNKLRQTK
jgi:hypothetical protein